MRKNLIKIIIALVAVNLVLTPAVHAAQNDSTFFSNIGSLVRDDFIFTQFLRSSLAGDEDLLWTVQKTALVAPFAPITGPVTSFYGRVVVTAYSSSYDETDSTPHITAAGTRTREGVIAANFLPFGTKIQIPDLFGDKIFVVEDRMNRRFSSGRVDIWFPTKWEAKRFGKNFAGLLIVDES